jgi:hypothetical protein
LITRTRIATFLEVGQDFAIETRVQTATEVTQDVVGREVQQGVFEQRPIDAGQCVLGGEAQIGAELGLIDDPAIAAFFEEGLVQQRIDGLDEAIENAHPVEFAELIGELLGLGGVIELHKGVVRLDEAQAAFEHLPGEPFMAVDVHLTGEGKHGLQADVHQAELGVEEVEVEDALRTLAEGELRTVLATEELDAAAEFFAAQDGDQAVATRLLFEQLMDEPVLVRLGFEVLVGGVGVLGQPLSVLDETLGERFDEGQEILAFDFEAVIDEAIEVFVAAEGKVAVKNHSVMAGQDGYNGRRESFDKTVHGVLLQRFVW